MKKRINIEGMSCQHCVHHVHEALMEIKGVKSANVSLEGKTADIEADRDIDDEVIRAAVADAGYEAVKIEAR